MIYDRLGQRIVPGSLMVRIGSGSLFAALNVTRYANGVEVSLRVAEIGSQPISFVNLLSLFGNEGEHLRMVEVIRYVELF